MSSSAEERPRAVVVGVQLPDVSEGDFASSLAELERLGSTLGLRLVGRVTQRRSHLAAGGVVGGGKLAELAGWTGGTGVIPSGATRKKRRIDPNEDEAVETETLEADDTGGDGESEDDEPSSDEANPFQPDTKPEGERATVVLVDHDLSPSQARNLERATGAEVLDRTSVILSIFQRHARTREARLQVEIARLAYLAPRLREAGAGGDRQRGGIGGKGAGESGVELDRRRIRDRIAELRHEVEHIQRDAGFRRSRRAEERTVALVGYTNAGKSSWMRALTSGDVYVADKLFATLDTTVRALQPEVKPRILVSDTVGFIKKLPHDLVASFRSTLEEAREAHLLVHVVDASDPAFRAQYAVTREVLGEVGADGDTLLLLNKIDRVAPEDRDALALEHPEAMMVSAKSKGDLERVHAALVAFFEKGTEEASLFVPWAKQAIVHVIHEAGRVVSEAHEDEGTRFVLRARPDAIARIQKRLDGPG
jgi:GTP-binding protein HflX